VANTNLSAAKNAKNDEFYTQYADIQKEVNAYLDYDPDVFRGKTILLPCDDPEWSNFTKFFAQNFEALGLKKLISTSYAVESKNAVAGGHAGRMTLPAGNVAAGDTVGSRVPRDRGIYYQPTLFEMESPRFDKKKTRVNGKIFVLDRATSRKGRIDINALEWKYLDGDGDFRSDEVRKLRDEADIVVTNPPFSLFREFLAWIVEADKKFLVIGNRNSVTYKDVYQMIKADKMWLSNSLLGG